MSTRLVKWMYLLVVALGLVWGVCFTCAPQGWQSRLFYAQGHELLTDFTMPRSCAGDRAPYRPQDVKIQDACYPALALALVHPFPQSQTGATVFTVLTGLALLAAAGLFVGVRVGRESVPLAVAATLMSSPFIFNMERGNPIYLAVAGVLVFLAWYDAEARWKREVAAVTLAVAGVLKIVPAVFGLLYFERRQWRDMAVCASAAAVLFLVPFIWYGGWNDGVVQWFLNAAENARYYMSRTMWGAIPVHRAVRMAQHLPITDGWPGVWISRMVSIAMAVGCLVLSFRRGLPKSVVVLLLAASVMMGSVNMAYYTGMLLLPAFLWMSGRRLSVVEVVLWVLLFCPLQFKFGAFETGRHVSNLAFLALVAWQAWGQFRTRNRS